MCKRFPEQVALFKVFLLPLGISLGSYFLLLEQALLNFEAFQFVLPVGKDHGSLILVRLSIAHIPDHRSTA